MEEARDRFFSKVNKTDACWLWTGGISVLGYGQFNLQKKSYKAHRFSWLLAGNTIPEGHVVRHTCRNRHCVNPGHLENGTQKQNIADMVRDGTAPIGNKHGRSKLTDDEVRAIRARHTENQRKLAKEFGVCQATITNIILRQRWKHLE
jgi:hypothetical protein